MASYGFNLKLKDGRGVVVKATAIDPSSDETWLILLRDQREIGRYRRAETVSIQPR